MPGLPGASAIRIDKGGTWKYQAKPDPLCNPDDLYRQQSKYGYRGGGLETAQFRKAAVLLSGSGGDPDGGMHGGRRRVCG